MKRIPFYSLLPVLFCGILFQAIPFTSHAQSSAASFKVGDKVAQHYRVPPRDGEFRKSWPPGIEGISCMTAGSHTVNAASQNKSYKEGRVKAIDHAGAPAPNPNDFSYMHCLRMGPFQLGNTLERIQLEIIKLGGFPEEYIAAPKVVSTSSDGIRTLLFPISTMQKKGQTHLLSYLVVLVDRKDMVLTLQLTGKPDQTTPRLPFSSIRLGMPKEKIVDILGYPSSVSDVPQIQGKLWRYEPFPFSVEMVQGKVYSVRLDTPDERSAYRPFRPLKAMPD